MSPEKSGFRQLMKNLIAGKKQLTGRTGMQQPFMEICRTVLAHAVLGNVPHQISCESFMFSKHDGTITSRESRNSSQLASIRTELFRLTNFIALQRELEKPEIRHNLHPLEQNFIAWRTLEQTNFYSEYGTSFGPTHYIALFHTALFKSRNSSLRMTHFMPR